MNPRIAERPLVSRIFDEEENDRDADDYFVESWEKQLCKNKPICFQTLFNLDVNGEKEAEQVADEALDVPLVSNAEVEEIKKGLLDVQEGMQKMSKSMEEGFEKMFNLIGGQDTRLKAVESFVNSHTWNAGEWSGGGGVEKQTDGAEWSGGGGVEKQTDGVCGGMEVEMEGEDGVGEEDKDKDKDGADEGEKEKDGDKEEDKDKDGADEGEKEKDGDKEEDKDKDGGDEEEETDKDGIDEEDKEKDGADDEDKAKSKKKKDGGKKKKDVVEKEVVGEKRKRKPSEYGKSPYTLLRPRTRQNTKTKKN